MGLSTHTHPLQHATETAPMTLPEAVSFSLTPLLVSVPNHLPSRCTCESTPSTGLLANIRASSYIASNERCPSPTSEYSPRVTALRRSQHRTADSMVTVPDEVSFSMTWLLDSVPGHSPSKCSCKSSPSTSAHLHPTCSLHCAADGITSRPLLTTLRCSQLWTPHSQAPVTTRDGHRVNHYAGERFLFPGWNFRFND